MFFKPAKYWISSRYRYFSVKGVRLTSFRTIHLIGLYEKLDPLRHKMRFIKKNLMKLSKNLSFPKPERPSSSWLNLCRGVSSYIICIQRGLYSLWFLNNRFQKLCCKNHNIGRNIDDLKNLNKLRLENVAEIPNIGRFRNMARNMGPYIGYFL